MLASTEWQLARQSAERYQNILTPAILGPFARTLVEHAALEPGERVVDVGCGTGAATRYAAEAVGSAGHVLGVDVNGSMIDVARSLPPVAGSPIEWRVATATSLPLPDQSVDVALCAQTLQFVPERLLALSEMRRVIKPTGRVALSLWCNIKDNAYFCSLVEAIARHVGLDTAAGLKSAFSLSDANAIYDLLKAAGFRQIEMVVKQLDLPLPELTEFLPRHISATPMDAGFQRVPAAMQQAVIREVSAQLSAYRMNGQPRIPFKSHFIMSRT